MKATWPAQSPGEATTPKAVTSLRLVQLCLGLLSGGWFEAARADPVADALADPRKFVIEAEDYNFGGGQHKASASVMPYYGGFYEGLSGIDGVDFRREPVSGFGNAYRPDEQPVVPAFEQSSAARSDRGTWSVSRNYSLALMEPGQWFNYTRYIPRGGYRVWLAASFQDRSEGGIRGQLQKVTGGADTANPVIEDLGFFDAPGSGDWGTVSLVPLQTSPGDPLLDLGEYGEIATTLRYVPISGDPDFILLQFVVHVDPATLLRAVVNPEGRIALIIVPGLNRPRVLQGTVELDGQGASWHDLNWDFARPFVVPEGSADRFFRLVFE